MSRLLLPEPQFPHLQDGKQQYSLCSRCEDRREFSALGLAQSHLLYVGTVQDKKNQNTNPEPNIYKAG